jgi:hypothetical protein
MTHDDRTATLHKWGYPGHQAAFLAHVLVHGGCFIRRQFVAFQGRPDGGAVTDFLRRLVGRGHARRRVFGRRTVVYQVRDRAMYEAVGLPRSHDSRRAAPAALVRRLMTLDVVLSLGDRRVLATEAEKYSYFTSERQVSVRAFPGTWYPGRQPHEPGVLRYFVDRVPVAIDQAEGRVSFLYVQGPATSLAGWTTFLHGYAALLTTLLRADVVFCTVDVPGFEPVVRAAFIRWMATADRQQRHETSGLRLALTRYFDHRKWAEQHAESRVPTSIRATVGANERRFRDPRFAHLYSAWRASGDWVLDEFFVTQPGICVDHVGLRFHAVRHRYDCFGTSIAHDVYCQRASGEARDRRIDSALESAP